MSLAGLNVAKTLLGDQEVRDKSTLEAFFKANSHNGDMDIDPSQTSWCADFINCCERAAGNTGTGKLNAQSFKTYGQPISMDNAQPGDIVVFHFPFDSKWQGHVTYFISWNDDDNTVQCLGGNQHDSVCISSYNQDYITNIRR